MSEANKTIMQRWFDEVWNEGKDETVDELFASSGIACGLGETDPPVKGPAEFKVFARNMRSTLDEFRVAIDDQIAEGDKVSVRFRVTGVHNGSGLGVPPTGRSVKFAGIVIVRIEKGQIVEAWNSWDQLGLLRQIGALPGPEGGDRFMAGV